MKSIIFLILLCCCLSSTHVQGGRGKVRRSPPPPPRPNAPAGYSLVMVWPASYCTDGKNHCKGPIPEYFTIHGLWDDYKGLDRHKYYPNPMDLGVWFRGGETTPRLNKMWPNLTNNDGNINFWRHESNDHGRYQPQDPLNYFMAAWALATKYDLKQILESSGITPGKIYTGQTIESAFTEKGLEPIIRCVKPQGRNFQIFEITLCVDKDAKTVISCGSSISRLKNCGNLDVLFPGI